MKTPIRSIQRPLSLRAWRRLLAPAAMARRTRRLEMLERRMDRLVERALRA